MSARLDALEQQLRAIGDGYSATCTWSLTDLTTREHIGHDQDVLMPTASLIKVLVLAALYAATAAGGFALDDPITYGPEHRCLGSGVLSKLFPGVQMRIRDAAVLMMTISDNSATNMCIDLIGLDAINGTMRALGLDRTALLLRLGDRAAGLDARRMSVSTAGEMARLMTLIADHQCVSAEASEDMMRIMRRSDYRHELSSELPWNEMNMLGDDPRVAWVAEKGGSFLNGVRTGAAIFKGANGIFAMSAFCEGGTAPGTGRASEGNHTLGRLGKAAWDALSA